eukprot:TRINITY_DN3092_c1_g1_i1.p1 TRINITY_DN3092_c1_g1~~TRINITY_DN3092_c1_g1_i1.p1  ORF type:complete len:2151 (+),score=624.71 TRINITY_DN3092_c1_g1_i1:812-6454(+)
MALSADEGAQDPDSPTSLGDSPTMKNKDRRVSSILRMRDLTGGEDKKPRQTANDAEHATQQLEAGLEVRVRRFLKSGAANDKFATTGFKELLQHAESSASEDEPLGRPPPEDKPDELRVWRKKIKPNQVSRFLRQYLQRSVPNAAGQIGAVVVCNEGLSLQALRDQQIKAGDMARALNKGFFGLNEQKGKKNKGKPAAAPKGAYVARTCATEPGLLGVHSLPDSKLEGETQAKVWWENVGQVCSELNHFTQHLFLWGGSGPANRQNVLDYTNRLVDTLAKGNTRNNVLDPSIDQAPERAGAQVCTILIGGDPGTSQLELMRNVANKWPILVVEGSFGYADDLAKHIHSVEDLVGAPSMDDFRRFLGKADPNTRAIITSGLVTLVPKGTPADQVERLVVQSLTVDRTLHMAWLKYATWDYNAWVCRKLFILWQWVILMTGIIAVAMSILLTYLQLRFPEETGVTTSKSNSSTVSTVYNYLGIVVVILPVGLSLCEAIQNKLNAGGRWVDLRTASETLLREIYMYRTQTGRYALDKISESQHTRGAAADGGDDEDSQKSAWEKKDKELARKEQIEADQGGRSDNKAHANFGATDGRGPYKTRQEKLNFWIEHLVEALKDGVAAQSSMKLYRGPLPPAHVLDTGDAGWTDLTPEEYVAYRLKPLHSRYQRAAELYERRVKKLNLVNYGLGAAGTLLAALSSLSFLSEHNLQAWVALTTAISNAVTRYIDYTRLEFLQKKGNDVSMKLTNVQSWWEGRSSTADGQTVRDDLVHQVEELVTGEFLEWGGQMKKAMERAKKEKKERERETEEMVERLRTGQDLDQVKKMRELGLEGLNSHTLAAALQNPGGAEALKIMESVQCLNDRIEENTGVNMKEEVMKTEIAKEAAKKVEMLKETSEKFIDEAGNLLDINLGGIALSDFVPAELVSFVKDPKARRKMFRDVAKLDIGSLRRADCIKLLGKAGEGMRSRIHDLTQRQMLECVRSACAQQLEEQFTEALGSINVGLFELIPRKEMLEVLLMELRDMNEVPWRQMPKVAVCELFKDPQIRAKMNALHEVTMRRLLKRADKIVNPVLSHTAGLLYQVYRRIAKLDTAELFRDPHIEAEMFDVIDDLAEKQFGVEFLAKEEILQKLPVQVRDMEVVKSKTHAQLVEYIHSVRSEFNVSRVFKAYLAQVSQQEQNPLPFQTHDPSTDPVMDSLKKNKRLCDRFVYAVKSVNQSVINKSDRSVLMKTLQASPALSQDMLEEIKFLKKDTLKHVMSGVKALVANSYQGRVFDSLCDEVSSVDIRNLITNPENRERFVNRMQEFKGLDVGRLSKQEMITTLAYRDLVACCLKLSEEQLREVISRALVLMGSGFSASIFSRTVRQIQEAPSYLTAYGPITDLCQGRLLEYKSDIAKFDTETVDRICMALTPCPRYLHLILKDPELRDPHALALLLKRAGAAGERLAQLRSDLESALPDPTVLDCFRSWRPVDMWVLLSEVRLQIGERVATGIFESCARDCMCVDEDMAGRFRMFFFDPTRRRLLMECIMPLASEPMSELQKESEETLMKKMALITYGGGTRTAEGFSTSQLQMFAEGMREVFESSVTETGELVLDPGQSGNFKRVLMMILNECMMSTPHRIFQKLAVQIAAFDLRDLVDDPRSRRLLPVLILKCFLSDDPEQSVLGPDGPSGTHTLKSAKGILDALDNLGEHLTVVNNMRLLSREQCQRLVKSVVDQYVQSQIGRFFVPMFQTVQRFRDHGGLKFEHLMEAVSAIKGHMQLAPAKVNRDLRFYDATQFDAVFTVEQRLEVLMRYIPDEDCAAEIARADVKGIEQLFAHLRALPYSQMTESSPAPALRRPQDGKYEAYRKRAEAIDQQIRDDVGVAMAGATAIIGGTPGVSPR